MLEFIQMNHHKHLDITMLFMYIQCTGTLIYILIDTNIIVLFIVYQYIHSCTDNIHLNVNTSEITTISL